MGTPILYCTILHYTTRIYLSIRFTRTGNPVCYLPTYLLSVGKYGMVWVGGKLDIVNFPRLFLK